ncbi:MAG: hypothetical protein ABIH46_11030 [Chloroflexota bacterium]
MAIVARDSGRQFEPAPEGVHVGVCVDVVDKGPQDTPWGKKQKVELRFQIEEKMESGEHFLALRWFTNSLNERAALREFLETWRGKRYTDEEAKAGVDLEGLINVPALLTIVHTERDNGGVFATIKAATKLPKGTVGIKSLNYIRVQDRHEEAAEPDADEPF